MTDPRFSIGWNNAGIEDDSYVYQLMSGQDRSDELQRFGRCQIRSRRRMSGWAQAFDSWIMAIAALGQSMFLPWDCRPKTPKSDKRGPELRP